MASDAQKDGPISSAGVIRVNRIEIFPVKSFDGVLLEEATITAGGILENDRVYAIVDEDGAFVNGKRTARVHDLRCAFAKSLKEISVWESGQSPSLTFSLEDREPLGRWLSDFIGFRVSVKYEPRSGFPDDSAGYGPTVVGDASLREVQTWYASLSRDNVRRRFRSNIELEGGEAFCEDALFGAPGELKPFRLGAVADTRRFNHFYRFALNTSMPPAEAGKRLRVGDPLMA